MFLKLLFSISMNYDQSNKKLSCFRTQLFSSTIIIQIRICRILKALLFSNHVLLPLSHVIKEPCQNVRMENSWRWIRLRNIEHSTIPSQLNL
jgi:hypothetical protein